jgi:microcompartment protein CcmK/EutM
MWQAIANVSGGVTLVACLAALLVAGLYRKAVVHERLVRSFAPKDRLKALRVLRVYVPADSVGLAPEQQFLLARGQIRRRAERRKQGAIVLAVIVFISAAFALASHYFGIGRE